MKWAYTAIKVVAPSAFLAVKVVVVVAPHLVAIYRHINTPNTPNQRIQK